MEMYAIMVDFDDAGNVTREVKIIIDWKRIHKMEPDFLRSVGPILRVSYFDEDSCCNRVMHIKANGIEVE